MELNLHGNTKVFGSVFIYFLLLLYGHIIISPSSFLSLTKLTMASRLMNTSPADFALQLIPLARYRVGKTSEALWIPEAIIPMESESVLYVWVTPISIQDSLLRLLQVFLARMLNLQRHFEIHNLPRSFLPQPPSMRLLTGQSVR